MWTKNEKMIIVGAGLIGSLLSILLAKLGYLVEVYEQDPDYRKEKCPFPKFSNLVLSNRGWKALCQAGLSEKLQAIALPIQGRLVHSIQGESQFLSYGNKDKSIFSLSRKEVYFQFLKEMESHKKIHLFFSKKALRLDFKKNELLMKDQNNGQVYTVKGDIIWGADGTHSICRSSLQRTDRFNYSQQYLEHGYKEFTIPPKINEDFAMEGHVLHIWPRKNFLLVAFPKPDKSFSCHLYLPFKGECSFESIGRPEDLACFLENNFPKIAHLFSSLKENYFSSKLNSICTTKAYPWTYQNKVALIGDASHSIIPFYGQGANCGLESCSLLSTSIEKFKGDWKQIFSCYEQTRKPNSDALSKLSLHKFWEIKNSTTVSRFLLRKKIEERIHNLYPSDFVPLYSLITFDHISYEEAWKKGKKQNKLLDVIMSMSRIEEKWKQGEIDQVISLCMCQWLEK